MSQILRIVILVFALSFAVSAQKVSKGAEAYNRGLEQQTAGEVDAALKSYDEAIRRDDRFLDACNNRANLRLQNGDRAGAIADLSKVIELANDHPLSFYNRGNIFLEDAQFEKAISDYTKAIDLLAKPGENYDLMAHAMAHNNRGNAFIELQRYKEAMPDYDRSLEILPNNFQGLTSRGSLKHTLGDYRSAVVDFNAALKIFPESTLVLMNRAASLEFVDAKASIADYSSVISLEPDNARAFLRRGLVYRELKNRVNSVADLKKAFALDPSLSREYSKFLK